MCSLQNGVCSKAEGVIKEKKRNRAFGRASGWDELQRGSERRLRRSPSWCVPAPPWCMIGWSQQMGSFITQKVKSANITSNANQTLNDELRTHSYKPFKYVYQFIVIYTFPDDTLRIVLQLDGDFITSPHRVSARPPLSPPHILESSVHFMLSWFKG